MSSAASATDQTSSTHPTEGVGDIEPNVVDIGRRIAAFRRDKGLSLGELAGLASVSKSYLSTVEKGSGSRPGANVLHKIAQALDVTLADLLGRQINADPTPIPLELRRLADERGLPPKDVEMLAGIVFRGTAPKTKERWGFIYDAIMNSAAMDSSPR